jgi:hypothetical protein
MLTAKKSFNIPLFENGRHSNSSGMPAIKKTLWLLPKSFLPLPLAGLEPARCYPLDFESSASANSATAARSHEPKIILPYIFKSRKCFCLFLAKNVAVLKYSPPISNRYANPYIFR